MSRKLNVPVEKNKEYTIDIVALSSEGMGIGKIEGFTIFTEGALPKEKVKILIVAVRSSFAYGRLLEILTPSEDRTEPKCHISKRCGGCSLQHLNYKGQLKYKTQLVKDALTRIGGLKDVEIEETIEMETPWRYRNKAQFPIAQDGSVGFYANRTHTIVPTSTCLIQDEVNDIIALILKEFVSQYNIDIYDENTGSGLIRHLVTRRGFKTGEIMVILVINGEKLDYSQIFVDKLIEKLPMIKSIVLNINKDNTNVILGNENKIIYGNPWIYDYTGEYIFKISPQSFFQVNPIQTEKLYGKVLEYADLTGKETVIDAYCGIGTISLFLSKRAGKIYGVEIVPGAIADAKENAHLNKVENAEFICGESEKVIPAMYEDGIRADVIVVDPPRKGCDEKLLEVLLKMNPNRIVYVSCNPATLARDLKYLCTRDFEVKKVQPVDMFPQGVHVEVICLLTSKIKA